jgi:hypothetical protein
MGAESLPVAGVVEEAGTDRVDSVGVVRMDWPSQNVHDRSTKRNSFCVIWFYRRVSTDKVKVGGIHLNGEATHDKRKSKYHPPPVLIAQNNAHLAGESSLIDADSGPDNQVRMRFTVG